MTTTFQKISFRFVEHNGLHAIEHGTYPSNMTVEQCIEKWFSIRVAQFAKMSRPMPIQLDETEVLYVG